MAHFDEKNEKVQPDIICSGYKFMFMLKIILINVLLLKYYICSICRIFVINFITLIIFLHFYMFIVLFFKTYIQLFFIFFNWGKPLFVLISGLV